MRAHDHERLARRDRLERLRLHVRLERARQQRDPDSDTLEQGADGLEMLAGQQVGRGEQRALEPGPSRRGQAVRRHRGLARSDVALQEAEHRHGPGEVVPDSGHRRDLVYGQLDGLPHPRPDRVHERGPDRVVRGGVQGHDRRRVADPLPPALDHPDLEGEELVEGEPFERCVATLERLRVVRLLDGPGDRHESLLGQDRRRQVLGIGAPGLVEGLTDRGPQARGRQTGREGIDRDDPAGVEDLGVAREHLELGVVEGQPAPEVLDLPRHDDLAADVQPPLDEAPTEPRRIDTAGVILEPRDRALDPTPETGLDPHVPDGRLGRHDRAVLFDVQIAQLAHLAQIVVSPGQVEEEIADGVEAETDPGAPKLGRGGQARLRQRGPEQLDRVGRRGRKRRSLLRGRDLRHRPPYSAEIRYR